MKIAIVALFSVCMHQMCVADNVRGLRRSKPKTTEREDEEMPEIVEIDFLNSSVQPHTSIQSIAVSFSDEILQTAADNADKGIKKRSNETYRVIIQSKNEKKHVIMNFLSDIALTRDIEIHHEFDEFNTVVASVCEETLNDLKNHDDTHLIEDDLPLIIEEPVATSQNSFQIFSTDSSQSVPYGVSMMEDQKSSLQSVPYGVSMMEGLKLSVEGSGAKVCILDDGYSMTHGDLPKDVEWITPQHSGGSHGTHVAGTIAAMNNGHGVVGVSPKAELVVGAYLGTTFLSSTVDGIRKCRDKGAKIVNMSFGPGSILKCRGGNFFNPWENDAMNHFLKNDDMLLVAAAGNHGGCSRNAGALSYPASYDAVISVGAVDSNAKRSNFSAKNNRVDIVAPGSNVRSTVNNGWYESKSGTSMAAPHVVGVAALIRGALPWLSAEQVRNHLYKNAQFIGSQSYVGAGLADTGFFPIASKHSGKCLNHQGATSYGVGMHQWECNGGNQSLWMYDETTKLIVSSTGLCLDASPPHKNGSTVHVWGCNPNNGNQRWSYDKSRLTLKNNGYCLDVSSAGFKNGQKIHMWSCHNGANQQWVLGSDKKALLCQHSDCNDGGNFSGSFGHWSTMPSHVGNDALSRVHIDQDVTFHYFDHESFLGWNVMFGSKGGVNLNMGGHNDSVSSFKIGLIPAGKVKLCPDKKCKRGTYHAAVGDFLSMPESIGNNALSRVHIPNGFSFHYYQDTKFGGWNKKFGSCDHGINLNMGGHRYAESSFRVRIAC